MITKLMPMMRIITLNCIFFFFINLDNILWLRQTDREGERDRGIFIRRDPIEVSSICL